MGCSKPTPPPQNATPAVEPIVAPAPVAKAPAAPVKVSPPPPAAPAVAPTPPVQSPPQVEPAKPEQPRVAKEPDAERLLAHGIRRVPGKHVVLFTDHPADAEVDALPGYFDQAYPQWCDYFGKPEDKSKPWRMNAFLIFDRDRCHAAGLLPDRLPKFLHGYALGLELWLYEQTSPYYRRHLLLHEGTHAFMEFAWGGLGPPWYAEGIAELVATHQIVDGKLRLNYFPRDAQEVRGLGRIRLIQNALEAGDRLTIGDVMAYGHDAHRQVNAYAWSWALAALLESRPSWRTVFRAQREHLHGGDFNPQLAGQLGTELPELHDSWAVFTSELTHAYDFERAAILFQPGKAAATTSTTVRVEAARGWQSTGLKLVKGKSYRVTAAGQCVVARTDDPWPSEPQGVSVRYYRGRPLGRLLAVVRPDKFDVQAASPFLAPLDIGAESTITAAVDGTLYLRINDSPAELADNEGSYQVTVTPAR
ncbi:MAG: hypothetical protein JNM18_21730 [Planctomycetaceae bacterium]|nr:hypothetical protein [Planctomycetaceae bacterium]